MKTFQKMGFVALALATTSVGAFVTPASADDVGNDCFDLTVSEDRDGVTLKIRDYDDLFESDGDIDEGHDCFDIVHVDGLVLNDGDCVEVPLHPDEFGGNWTDENVAESFSWDQKVSGSSLDVELFNHADCTGSLGSFSK